MSLEEGRMNNKPVGGRLWGNVCREWWYKFAKMCVGDVRRLRECSI